MALARSSRDFSRSSFCDRRKVCRSASSWCSSREARFTSPMAAMRALTSPARASQPDRSPSSSIPAPLHSLGRKTQVRKPGDFGGLALTLLLQGFLPRREPRREFRVSLEVPLDFLLPRRQVDGRGLDRAPALLHGPGELGDRLFVRCDAPLAFLGRGTPALQRLPQAREQDLPGPELLLEPGPLDPRSMDFRSTPLHRGPPLLHLSDERPDAVLFFAPCVAGLPRGFLRSVSFRCHPRQFGLEIFPLVDERREGGAGLRHRYLEHGPPLLRLGIPPFLLLAKGEQLLEPSLERRAGAPCLLFLLHDAGQLTRQASHLLLELPDLPLHCENSRLPLFLCAAHQEATSHQAAHEVTALLRYPHDFG